jgi:hypothetical protein
MTHQLIVNKPPQFNPKLKAPNLMDGDKLQEIINNKPLDIQIKIQNMCIECIKNHYKIIIVTLFIMGCFYWRYNEIKKKNKRKNFV